MKVIQVKQPGGPEVLELVELPVPQAKPHEAVVKIAVSGVNYIDVNLRNGAYKAPLPFLAGQEGAGVITSVGAAVRSLRPGDRVAWSGVLGSYAEYVAAPAAAPGAGSRGRGRPRCRFRHAARHDRPLLVL
jgi:NADPH2:quinone reductase